MSGCSHRTKTHVPPAPSALARIGSTETGIASWYGVPYDGRPAANGETYNMEELTAAHRTLPFGAWVKVDDLDNGKRVDVRITDRGPFVKGRVIDLSLAAAREIDMLGPGLAHVRVTVIAAPANVATNSPLNQAYAVQAGAFSERDRADSLRASLDRHFKDVRVIETSTLWRVLIGRGLTIEDAHRLAAKIRHESGDAVVVRDR